MIKSLINSGIFNPQDYRSMLAGAVPSNEYLIDTRLLESTTASITFDNLAQYAGVYKHLQIVMTTRMSASANISFMYIQLNSDTGANYTRHGMWGNGSTVQNYAIANTSFVAIPDTSAATSPANSFGAAIVDILDAYSTTKNKTIRTLGGYTGGQNQIQLSSGVWRNTAAVSSITITGSGSSAVSGSRFSLYGVTA